MGNATIMDVFNAAAGAHNQTLGILDSAMKYKYDTRLFNKLIEREKLENELINDYTRVDSTGNNPYQQNPELYKKHVEGSLKKWYADAEASGDKRPYYLERLRRADAKSNLAMMQRVEAVKLQSGQQQAAIEYQKEQNTIDNAGWDIDKTLATKIEAHNRYNGINAMDAVTAHKDKAAIYNSIFERARNINIGSMTTVEAMQTLERNMKMLEETAKTFLSDGESLDSYLTGKNEKLAEAKQSIRLAVWKRNYTALDTLDNEYRRMAADAKKMGNVTLMNAAHEMWRYGSRLREQAMESSEYNPDDSAKIQNMFPVIDVFGERKSGKKEDVADSIKESRDYWLRQAAEGKLTYNEAKTRYEEDLKRIMKDAGITDVEKFEKEGNSKEINLTGLYGSALDMLKKERPEYAAALKPVETYYENLITKAKTPGEKALLRSQLGYFTKFAFDKIFDSHGVARPTPDQIQAEVMSLATKVAEGQIAFVKQTAENTNKYEGGVNDAKFSQAIHEIIQNPFAAIEMDGVKHTLGDTAYMDGIKEQAKDNFSKMTGIPVEKLNTDSNVKEGPNDIAAEFQIQVLDGEHKGVYRFNSDGKGKYWIEEHKDDGWQRTKWDKMAQAAHRENEEKLAKQQSELAAKQKEQEAKKHRDKYFKKLSEMKDPQEKKQLVQSLTQPGDNNIPVNEFFKAGLDPNTGEQLKTIPYSVWSWIINNELKTEPERQIQRNIWAAKKIKLEEKNR